MTSALQRFVSKDFEIIEAALRQWAEYVTGLQAIWMGENAPQPAAGDLGGAYVAMSWLTAGDVGDGAMDRVYNETTGRQEWAYQVTRTYGVNVVVLSESTMPGTNAMTYANALCDSLNFDDVQEDYLRSVGIATKTDDTNVVPLPSVRDSKFMSKAGFDFGMNYASVGKPGTAGSAGVIDTVVISSAITASGLTAGGTLTIDGTV